MRHSLKGKKQGRSWESLVDYTLAELVAHLERQFTKGMSWDNYGLGNGKWHIDHIIPVTAFSFESETDPDFKACWGLPNLRPMWGSDNIRKSNKRVFLL